MTGKGTDDQGIVVRFPAKVIHFSLLPNTKTCPKLYSASYKTGNGVPFLGVKRPGVNIKLSLSGAKVWSYIPFPHVLSWHCV